MSGIDRSGLVRLSGVVLFRLLLPVAIFTALAIGERGIKLLFAHKYYASLRSIKHADQWLPSDNRLRTTGRF